MVDFTTLILIIFALLSIFSLPLFFYYLIHLNLLVITISLIFLILTSLHYITTLYIFDKLDKFRYLPYIYLGLIFYIITAIKEIILFFIRKNQSWDYLWPIYKKADLKK